MRSSPGRLALTDEQYESLRDELGSTPRIEGLSPTEVKVLAALRKAPLGLVSARAAASRARVSPTAASHALRSLEEQDLARRERRMLALGRARAVELWRANVLHPRWSLLAESLRRVQLPAKQSRRTARNARVPGRLRHLFWNAGPSQLDAQRAGPFIARRLLRTQDLDGLAWGAAHLESSDWREGARARGLDPKTRALAANLARHSA
jgi:DNA-binding transcriptional ArsR family regulator